MACTTVEPENQSPKIAIFDAKTAVLPRKNYLVEGGNGADGFAGGFH